jgi:RNA polymerase sigma-70 factor (ECF subfamily)
MSTIRTGAAADARASATDATPSRRGPGRQSTRRPAKDFVLTAYAQVLITFKARQLSRRPGFTSSDREDVENDLWAALASQAEHFDPTKSSFSTFAARVIDTAVTMILRDRSRKKRAAGFRAQSLDSPGLGSPTTETLSARVSAADVARRTGVVARDEISIHEDAEAVRHALALMPGDVREVCRLLMGGGTVSSVARNLGVSRRQVRKSLASARPFLERAGFGNY